MSDQIDVNQLSNAIQQKVDLPSGKSQADIDYVIESQLPTSENNYTWYRLYKSGWVEQGGSDNRTTTGNTGAYSFTINLPITMADDRYTVFTNSDFSGGTSWYPPAKKGSSTTQAIIGGWVNGSSTITLTSWKVEGMSAQGGIS